MIHLPSLAGINTRQDTKPPPRLALFINRRPHGARRSLRAISLIGPASQPASGNRRIRRENDTFSAIIYTPAEAKLHTPHPMFPSVAAWVGCKSLTVRHQRARCLARGEKRLHHYFIIKPESTTWLRGGRRRGGVVRAVSGGTISRWVAGGVDCRCGCVGTR